VRRCGTEVVVFALYCPRHGHQVLLDLDRLSRMINLGGGLILLEARCYDGEPLTCITGRRATLPPDEVGHRPATPPAPDKIVVRVRRRPHAAGNAPKR
jgi:hypothetical protein